MDWVVQNVFAVSDVRPFLADGSLSPLMEDYDPVPGPDGPRPVEPATTAVVKSGFLLPSIVAGLTSLGVAILLAPRIAAALASLFGFTRITRSDLESHPVRQSILDAVRAHPGIHVRELQRTLNLSRGVADHHLRKLLAAGLLNERAADGYRCLFIAGAVDRRTMDAATRLRSEGAHRVLDAALAEQGLGVLALARRTGLTPPTISYHLRRLAGANLVAITIGTDGHHVTVTEAGRIATAAFVPAQRPTTVRGSVQPG